MATSGTVFGFLLLQKAIKLNHVFRVCYMAVQRVFTLRINFHFGWFFCVAICFFAAKPTISWKHVIIMYECALHMHKSPCRVSMPYSSLLNSSRFYHLCVIALDWKRSWTFHIIIIKMKEKGQNKSDRICNELNEPKFESRICWAFGLYS